MNALTFAQAFDKGYPEFNPAQDRDEHGRWSGGSKPTDLRNAKTHDGNDAAVAYFERVFPGARVRISLGRVSVRSDAIRFSANFYPGDKGLDVDNMEASDNAAGRRAAASAFRLIRQIAIDSGADHISIRAGMEFGGYAWPRLGFEHETDNERNNIADTVESRLRGMQTLIPVKQQDEVRQILAAGGPEMAHRISKLDYPIRVEAMWGVRYSSSQRTHHKPTLGKALLMGTTGAYVLPRSKFGRLEAITKSFGKGQPEFREDQARAADGTWVSEGGSTSKPPPKPKGPYDVRGVAWEPLETSLQALMPPGFKVLVDRNPDTRERQIEIVKYNPNWGYHEHDVRGGNNESDWQHATATIRITRNGIMHADYFRAEDSHEGRAAASAVMRAIHRLAMDSDVEKIFVEAGLTHGNYIWPRLGFDLRSGKEAVEFADNMRYQLNSAFIDGAIEEPTFVKYDRILMEGRRSKDVTLATKLARMDDPLPPNFLAPGGAALHSMRGRPTVSKYLMSHGGQKYVLPRAKFAVLRVLGGGASKRLSKGYPEFNEQQARAADGTWTVAGTATRRERRGTLDIRQMSQEELSYALHERTGRKLRVDVRGDYPNDFMINAGDNVTGMKVKVRGGGKTIDASYLEAPDTAEGRATAVRLMMALRDLAIASGAEEIVTEAGLSHGGYLWPRLGFELLPDNYSNYFLVGHVEGRARMLFDAGVITQQEYNSIDTLLASESVHWPSKVAAMDRPLSLKSTELYRVTGYTTVRGDQTVGKVLLAGTTANYRLPRAKFANIGRLGKSVGFDKGYPEYQPDQPRAADGTWTGGSSSASNLKARGDQAAFQAEVGRRIGDANVRFTHGGGFEIKFGKDTDAQAASISYSGTLNELQVGMVRAPDTSQGSRWAVAVMKLVRDLAITNGADAIKIEAGLGMGGYLWPRIGFELDGVRALATLEAAIDTRLAVFAAFVPAEQIAEVRSILSEPDASLGTRIAWLDYSLSPQFEYAIRSNETFSGLRGHLTLGKVLLGGTKVSYQLRRSNFNALNSVVGSMHKADIDKGYPEFNEEQARAPDGTWSRRGSLDVREDGFHEAVKQRFPGADVSVTVGHRGHRYVRITGYGADGYSGKVSFSVSDHGVYVGMLEVGNDFAGRKFAQSAMHALRDIAIASGSETINLEAGLSMGGYTWPRLGFDLSGNGFSIRDEVRARAGALAEANLITPTEEMIIDEMLGGWNKTTPTQISRMSRVVPPFRHREVIDNTATFIPRVRGKQTVGKLLLANTSGSYVMPRSKFNTLGVIKRADEEEPTVNLTFAEALAKYRADQARDERGRWTSEGGGSASASEKPRRRGGRNWTKTTGREAQELFKSNFKPMTYAQFIATLTPEQRKDIDRVNAKMGAGITTDRLVSEGGHMTEDGKWTAERQAIHRQIIEKYLSPENIERATPAEGERPTVVFTGGRPASGKTTALNTMTDLPFDSSKFITLNPDDVKEMLPNYDKELAGLWQTESSEITDQIAKMAQDMGLNVIYDATMKNPNSIQWRVDQYEDAGYDMQGYFVHTAPHVTALRTVTRHNFGAGRFVPPMYTLQSYSNESSFDRVKDRFSTWVIFDGNRSPPKMVARGSYNRVYRSEKAATFKQAIYQGL